MVHCKSGAVHVKLRWEPYFRDPSKLEGRVHHQAQKAQSLQQTPSKKRLRRMTTEELLGPGVDLRALGTVSLEGWPVARVVGC